MANGQKLFDAALRRAVVQNNGELLRQAAESLLINAASGVPWAIQMLADRLDGKPQQNVEVKQVKSLEDMSLEELRNRVAELLAGDRQAAGSADEPRPVH